VSIFAQLAKADAWCEYDGNQEIWNNNVTSCADIVTKARALLQEYDEQQTTPNRAS
jgi:uncharacterized protein YukE